MRWWGALVVAVACATPNEVRYTETYNRDTFDMDRLVREAVIDAGYSVEREDQTDRDDRLVTKAIRIAPADHVYVAFVVVIEYGGDMNSHSLYGETEYAIVVVPHAYDADKHELDHDQVPASARFKARVLSSRIRQHLQRYAAS